jgi:hypothetical protein
MCIGGHSQHRTLLSFDLPANVISNGVTLVSATLVLPLHDGVRGNIFIHRINQSWSEGIAYNQVATGSDNCYRSELIDTGDWLEEPNVQWKYAHAAKEGNGRDRDDPTKFVPWITLGGDVCEPLVTVLSDSNRRHLTDDIDIRLIVQEWLNGEPNYGIMIRGTSEEIHVLDSRENIHGSTTQLTIEYQAIPSSSSSSSSSSRSSSSSS